MFSSKRKSKEYVELSIGKIYFYELTKKIVDKVERQAIATENVFSIAKYLQVMEQELAALSKRKLDNLSLSDANKLRKKVREILIEQELLVEEKPKEVNPITSAIHKEDIEWLDNVKTQQINKLQQAMGGQKVGR